MRRKRFLTTGALLFLGMGLSGFGVSVAKCEPSSWPENAKRVLNVRTGRIEAKSLTLTRGGSASLGPETRTQLKEEIKSELSSEIRGEIDRKLKESIVHTQTAPVRSQAWEDQGPIVLGKERIRDLQLKLNQLGFAAGRVNGVWGSQVQKALKHFQQSKGLDGEGQLTWDTLRALGLMRSS